MNIQKTIDKCISNGSKHICLSPRQYKTLFSLNPRQYKMLLRRRLEVAKPIKNWRYRGARVSVWGTRRMM